MKNVWKWAALGIAAASLVPFKLDRKENGDFDYASLLVRVTKDTDDITGERNWNVKFFNLPDCCKKCEDCFEEDSWADDLGESFEDAKDAVEDHVEDAVDAVKDAAEDLKDELSDAVDEI